MKAAHLRGWFASLLLSGVLGCCPCPCIPHHPCFCHFCDDDSDNGGDGQPVPSDVVVVAFAAPDAATGGQWVLLDASGSVDTAGKTLTFLWSQVADGVSPAVELVGKSQPVAAFIAPIVPADMQLKFEVRVGNGTLTSTGTVEVTVLGTAAPDGPTEIVCQPVGRVVYRGAKVRFGVWATGSGVLQWQWQKDGIDLADGGRISGGTSPTLEIRGAVAGDRGSYRCIVTGGGGAATSDAAALLVRAEVGGDFDGDGDLDGADFGAFSLCYNGAGNPAGGCEGADFDGDGDVNGDDYDAFVECFGGAGNPPRC